MPAQAGSGVPPLLERPAEDGVPPLLERPAEGGAYAPADKPGRIRAVTGPDGKVSIIPEDAQTAEELRGESFPVTQKALSGGSAIPQPMAQLAMEQAPEFRLTEDYLNRVESTIAKITDPRARELFIKRQWGILEKRAFDKEFGQMRSNFQRSVEMGEFHDVTEPGSDQFATNPEQVQGMLQVLDAIGNMAGVSGDPSDIRAARGALAQFFQRERELRGQYAQKRAAVQQKAAEKAAKIQVINQIAPMFPEVAARMWAELEGYDSRDLFPQDEFTGESQAGAFGGAMFGGAPQVGGAAPGPVPGQGGPPPASGGGGGLPSADIEAELRARGLSGREIESRVASAELAEFEGADASERAAADALGVPYEPDAERAKKIEEAKKKAKHARYRADERSREVEQAQAILQAALGMQVTSKAEAAVAALRLLAKTAGSAADKFKARTERELSGEENPIDAELRALSLVAAENGYTDARWLYDPGLFETKDQGAVLKAFGFGSMSELQKALNADAE